MQNVGQKGFLIIILFITLQLGDINVKTRQDREEGSGKETRIRRWRKQKLMVKTKKKMVRKNQEGGKAQIGGRKGRQWRRRVRL